MAEQVLPRQDLTELVSEPCETTEQHWKHHQQLIRYVGAQAIYLTHGQANEYAKWIRTIEEATGCILDLETEPRWLYQQLRVRPEEKPIPVNVLDWNTVCVYGGNQHVLASQSKGKRRAFASRAYSHLGALNYAKDLGLYLGPLFHSLIMDSPSPDKIETAGGFELWAVEQLQKVTEDYFSDPPDSGNQLLHRLDLAQTPEHQPGRFNLSSATLLEMGAYYADFDEILAAEEDKPGLSLELTNELSSNALLLAEKMLEEDRIGEYPYVPLDLNRFIADQIRRRKHDIRFVDLYRQAKSGQLDDNDAEEQYRLLQLDFIDDFVDWTTARPDQDGIAFEWITQLILRHYIYRNGLFDQGYVRNSTPREDYPEDGLEGRASSRKQAHDVYMKIGRQRYLYQCKLKSGGCYADPPVFIVKARSALGYNPNSSLMKDFVNAATDLKRIYLGQTTNASCLCEALEKNTLRFLVAA